MKRFIIALVLVLTIAFPNTQVHAQTDSELLWTEIAQLRAENAALKTDLAVVHAWVAAVIPWMRKIDAWTAEVDKALAFLRSSLVEAHMQLAVLRFRPAPVPSAPATTTDCTETIGGFRCTTTSP